MPIDGHLDRIGDIRDNTDTRRRQRERAAQEAASRANLKKEIAIREGESYADYVNRINVFYTDSNQANRLTSDAEIAIRNNVLNNYETGVDDATNSIVASILGGGNVDQWATRPDKAKQYLDVFDKYGDGLFSKDRKIDNRVKTNWIIGRHLKQSMSGILRPPPENKKTVIKRDRRGGQGELGMLGPRARMINNAYDVINRALEGRQPEPISPNLSWGDPFAVNSPYAGGNMGMMNQMGGSFHRIMQGAPYQAPGMVRLGVNQDMNRWLR